MYSYKNDKLIDYGEYYTSYGLYGYSKNGMLIATGGTGVIIYTILQLENEALIETSPALLEAAVIPGVQEEYLLKGQSISASEFLENEKLICENPISNFYKKLIWI